MILSVSIVSSKLFIKFLAAFSLHFCACFFTYSYEKLCRSFMQPYAKYHCMTLGQLTGAIFMTTQHF